MNISNLTKTVKRKKFKRVKYRNQFKYLIDRHLEKAPLEAKTSSSIHKQACPSGTRFYFQPEWHCEIYHFLALTGAQGVTLSVSLSVWQ